MSTTSNPQQALGAHPDAAAQARLDQRLGQPAVGEVVGRGHQPFHGGSPQKGMQPTLRAEVEAAFAGATRVVAARSMDEAVTRSAALARPGDAVLLSPGCASYDWYRNYGERGDDFARAVHELVGRP